jgi:large subunit ribosomal protein L23
VELLNPYDILIKPYVTEKTMLQIERENKIWFIVRDKSSKPEIKKAVEEISGMKVDKINVMRDKEGKKAVVKLKSDYSAEELATKLGIF